MRNFEVHVVWNFVKIDDPPNAIFQQLPKFLHADWFIAIVYKSTDNKNDVTCNGRAFSTEIEANSTCLYFFHVIVKKQINSSFLWSILL